MAKLELKDFLTLGNAVAGIVGISLAIAGKSFAWYYVFFALAFDFLDGRVARKTSNANEFGKQLDSLADTVSFVVAPAIIALHFQVDILLTAMCALYVCTGLLRLARFNLQKEKGVFFGLPTPFAALIVLLVNAFIPAYVVWALFVTAVAMVTPVRIRKF
ncbi:MAG: CDP-diacylglycerol--serine O-phosphatidyltransferase [Candidatus Micrarchaeota archaeon]